MVASGRAVAVGAVLAAFCAVGLLGLAVDQYNTVYGGDSLLETKGAKSAEVSKLEGLMHQQQMMEKKESKLLAGIEHAQAAHAASALAAKNAVHAQAALKAAAKNSAAPKKALKAAPKAKLEAPAKMQSLSQVDKVAQLKAELAAAEKAQAAKKTDKTAKAAAPAKPAATKADAKKEDAKLPKAAKKAITGVDFAQLPDKVGVTADHSIAKGAGLKGLGWMGSKDSVDSRLRALNCDPTSFVCSGTAAQKKEAMKIVKSIMDRVQHDAVAVKAYGWKEEHALPPAPHM